MTKEIKVVAFCCHSSAWIVAESAVKKGFVLPDHVKLIPIPCTERVNRELITSNIGPTTKAILLLGCSNGKCKNLYGSEKAKVRAAEIRNSLQKQGYSVGIEAHEIDINDGSSMEDILSKNY